MTKKQIINVQKIKVKERDCIKNPKTAIDYSYNLKRSWAVK